MLFVRFNIVELTIYGYLFDYLCVKIKNGQNLRMWSLIFDLGLVILKFMKTIKLIIFVIFIVISVSFSDIKAPLRYMEKLDRGVIAISIGGNRTYVGWRVFGNDPDDITFDVYRDGTRINSAPLNGASNFIDNDAGPKSLYEVVAVINGAEQGRAYSKGVWKNNYLDIPLKTPVGYTPNDASVGDLDGDGEYEIVIHQVGRGRDNSQKGYTSEPILQAYKLNGTMLWEINLGKNIREGAHYTQFIVYDFDCDGKAEVACKTADGTIDGQGNIIGKADADWRNKNGYVLSGKEYLTVFDGFTGKAVSTVKYLVPRHPNTLAPNANELNDVWGDKYGNRVDRFLAGVAYLDGEHPSLIMSRGYYTRLTVTAWDYKKGKLVPRWLFDSDDGTVENKKYRGQGNHQLSVCDLDADGKDEIVFGSCVIDDDGSGLYSTGLGHGDALHVSDLDPLRDGLEIWMCHEEGDIGATMRDAETGHILFKYPSVADVGRACTADILAEYPGSEVWASHRCPLYSAQGKVIGKSNLPINFAVWWDADLLRELLDGKVISKYSKEVLLSVANDCESNNSTKSTPALQADILGDWREEVIWRTKDNQNLRVYTTTDYTEYKIYTLMHDPQYRLSVAWQNVGYNQPPHTGFFLGHGMKTPPKPAIKFPKSE